ncbi:hypothetical protein KPA97_07390, partial [Burkholderia cenocepacia]|nr:hypothetical protein [Burkholderia cenocepacia]
EEQQDGVIGCEVQGNPLSVGSERPENTTSGGRNHFGVQAIARQPQAHPRNEKCQPLEAAGIE